MADSYPIRPVSHEEFEAFRYVDAQAFNAGVLSPERTAISWKLFEPARSLAAFDVAHEYAGASFAAGGARAGDIVGTAGAFTFPMAVPGAVLPVAGVSYVGVLPTHRRRGIARSLMTRQLTDIAALGHEPVAALWASEAPLYGRYGYGPAASVASFTFRRGEGGLRVPADPSLTLRLVSPPYARTELARVYNAVLPGQPGFFGRTDAWWDRQLADIDAERGAAGPLRCLLASDASGPRGYALYSAVAAWDEAEYLPESRISIRELLAVDPLASAALWRDLLSRDLVTEVRATDRSASDPLLHQLTDPRRARPMVSDGIWARLVDLPRALSSRAYCAPVDVVLEVRDDILPANAGRWRLRSAGTGSLDASCERTSDSPDVSLDIAELGAAYLGGTRLGTMAAAGLVTELAPGTLARLSTAMTWDPAPWCPIIF